MLFPKPLWDGLADGTITTAVRRWKRPTVKVGGTLRSPGGLLAIDAVDPVTEAELTAEDAAAAGCGSVAELLELLPGPSPDRTLVRVRFHPAGPDPREALRADDDLDADELAQVRTKLEGMDRRAGRDWTLAVLRLLDERPGVAARELAPSVGQERADFKADVRKLKGLGLTESLNPGYRLSPRGRAVLAALA